VEWSTDAFGVEHRLSEARHVTRARALRLELTSTFRPSAQAPPRLLVMPHAQWASCFARGDHFTERRCFDLEDESHCWRTAPVFSVVARLETELGLRQLSAPDTQGEAMCTLFKLQRGPPLRGEDARQPCNPNLPPEPASLVLSAPASILLFPAQAPRAAAAGSERQRGLADERAA